MLVEALSVSLGLAALWAVVATGLAWYHGKKVEGVQARLAVAESAVDVLRSVNADLRDRVGVLLLAAKEHDERDKVADRALASSVGGDPAGAAALLNGLHEANHRPGKT